MLALESKPQALKRKKIVNNPLGKENILIRTEEDFKKIYEAYFFRMLAYARILTKSDELAKDSVSEVFLSIWNTQRGSKIKNIESYLFTSLKRQCLKLMAIESKNLKEDDSRAHIEAKRDDYTPEDFLLTKETLAVIETSVEGLSDHCKLVFKLIKEQGMSYDEVAKELNISKHTVRNHLYRAVNQVRSDLDVYFSESQTSNNGGGRTTFWMILCVSLLIL
ncbi:MAG: sigma-70 family RNA polymerase sigma factor [Cyclobacteriaceae bacterium]